MFLEANAHFGHACEMDENFFWPSTLCNEAWIDGIKKWKKDYSKGALM